MASHQALSRIQEQKVGWMAISQVMPDSGEVSISLTLCTMHTRAAICSTSPCVVTVLPSSDQTSAGVLSLLCLFVGTSARSLGLPRTSLGSLCSPSVQDGVSLVSSQMPSTCSTADTRTAQATCSRLQPIQTISS